MAPLTRLFLACLIALLWPASLFSTTFMVTNTNDGGAGSLRQAISDANGNSGLDTIAFNIPGSGVHTITPAFPQLPSITSPVVIDGSTQPGFAGMPLIEISGATIGNNGNGLVIDAGGSTIRSLVINHGWSTGILLLANNCVIEGCFLGTDPTGTIALGNTQGIGTAASVTNNVIGGTTAAARNLISGNAIGVLLNNGATNNLIEGNFIGTDITGNNALGNSAGVDLRDSNNVVGGDTAAARNVIGANNTGIRVSTSTGNSIQGNFIGTDVTGTIALGGLGNGIEITAATQIGGLTATPGTPPGNVISGAQAGGGSGHGIFVGNGISNNVIQGNLIGTDATGTQPLGNGLDGVQIFGAANVIGGTDVMARNVISGNGRHGINLGTDNASVHDNLIQGNFIGTDITGTQLLGNAGDGVFVTDSINNTIGGVATPGAFPGNLIAGNGGRGVGVIGVFTTTGLAVLGNSIFSNGGLGIDLKLDGVTENDHCDGDPGPNNLQNYPVITSVTATESSTHIQGMLDSAPNTTFTIEFYANTECDASGNGEGRTYLGSAQVTTNASCTATIDATLPVGLPEGQSVVTATATDPGNNTSEFSQCVSVLQLTAAASRKTHGTAGTFDIDLPLMGQPGVECRTGGVNGNHTLVFTFSNNVVSGNASVTSGTGNVSGSPIFSGNTMTVNLTGVTDAQTITITLTNVTDSFGHVLPDTAVSMHLLLGDTNGNGLVNASDVSLTKAQVGQPVGSGNFREDVNFNGTINAVDVALVKSRVGFAMAAP